MISMLLSIFSLQKCDFCDFGPKVRKSAFLRTFAPQNALFALFAPKRKKRAWARNVALDNAFKGISDAICAKRRKMMGSQRF